MEKISFSLKLFFDYFYGQSFIKTVRGPCPELLTGRWFDIIFYIQTTLKKFKKVISKVMNILENIIENGAFASFFWLQKSKI